MIKKLYDISIIEFFEGLIYSQKLWLFFFITAFIIYSPLFLHFQFIVSSTDSVYGHYPFLLFGYRSLRHGSLGLWNPYAFAGMDFTRNMHNHILNPINWVLPFFPEKYLFQILTLIEFFEVAFVGVLALKIFDFFYDNRLVAFFAAIIVQLSEFTWFATTTYVGVEFFVVSLLFIYLVLTWRTRGYLASFLWMSLCSFLIFTNGDVGYICAFLFPVGFVFLFSSYKEALYFWRGITFVFILSILFGFLASLYRLLPELIHIYSFVQGMFPGSPIGVNTYLALTAIIPGFLTLSVGPSQAVLSAVAVTGRNIQFHNLLYFGLPFVFFVYFSLLNVFGRFIRFFAIITLIVALTPIYAFQPFSDIVSFIMLPFIHDIVFRTGGAFLFFGLAGMIGFALYQGKYAVSNTHLRAIVILVGFCVAVALTFWMRVMHAILINAAYYHLIFNTMRFVLIVIIFGSIWMANKIPITIKFSRLMTNWAFGFAALISLLALVFIHKTALFHYWPILRIYVYYLGVMVWSYLSIILLRTYEEKIKGSKRLMLLLSLLVLSILCLFVYAPNLHLQQSPVSMAFPVPLMVIKFIILSIVVWEFLVTWKLKKIPSKVFLILIMFFMMGDLLFDMKLYSFAGGPDFVSYGELYPPINQTRKIEKNTLNLNYDFKQYRVNYPDFYTENPYGTGFMDNFMVYNLRTYGGVESVVNDNLVDFLRNFANTTDEEFYSRSAIEPALENPRLLDLMGVKYDFNPKNSSITRPNALARFSLFRGYKVVASSEAVLKLLKNYKFDITKKVLINKVPEWKSQQFGARFEPVNFDEKDTDHIIIRLNLQHPAILFFGDSYSPDWQAYYNDEKIPIMLANGYFMATSVPKGRGVLSFVFYPILFYHLLKFSLFLFFIWMFLWASLLFTLFARSIKKIKGFFG